MLSCSEIDFALSLYPFNIFHKNHILVGSVILPTRTGILFFLSWTTKMKGRSTTISFCPPERGGISTPVAGANPSFVTWGRREMVKQGQIKRKRRTSTDDVCLILLTEMGPGEIPSNSASWLKTWVKGRGGQG